MILSIYTTSIQASVLGVVLAAYCYSFPFYKASFIDSFSYHRLVTPDDLAHTSFFR